MSTAKAKSKAKPRPPSSPGVDPIFAAIERHKAAVEAYEKAKAEEKKLTDKHPPGAYRAPQVVVGTATFINCPADVATQVEAAASDLKHRFGPKLAKRFDRPLKDTDKDLRKAYWRAEADMRQARQKAGIVAATKRMWKAMSWEEQTRAYLFRTKPRTIAGLAALLEHARTLYEPRDDDTNSNLALRDSIEELLGSIAEGAKRLSV